jgi:hypothetical protein
MAVLLQQWQIRPALLYSATASLRTPMEGFTSGGCGG